MKKIFNFLKTLLYGIIPALAGGCIVLDVYCIITNIQRITVGSGWEVVLYFALGVTELFFAFVLLLELGHLNIAAKKWYKYLKNNSDKSTDNIDSSTSDCETSDKATDTSSDTKSKSKHKKS